MAAVGGLAVVVVMAFLGEAKGVEKIIHRVMCDHIMAFQSDLMENAPEVPE